MFAHQVIEDIEKRVNIYAKIMTKDGVKEELKTAIAYESFYNALARKKIIDAVKFHLPKQTCEGRHVKFNKGSVIFLKGETSTVRLPYKITYLDSEVDYGDSNEPERKKFGSKKLAPISRKRAIVCEEFNKNVFAFIVINHFASSSIENTDSQIMIDNGLGNWQISPIAGVMIIGKGMKEANNEERAAMTKAIKSYNPMIYVSEETFDNSPHNANCIPIHYQPSITVDEIAHFTKENADELITLSDVLVLLSCKNIGTETVPAPEKLNKKRKKAGKLPIFSYKTLVIKPTGKKQESVPKHLWNNRIHLARGHFKTYTKEKPLFGRITGRFWWQPHVRGQNHEGVVIKNYEVKTK